MLILCTFRQPECHWVLMNSWSRSRKRCRDQCNLVSTVVAPNWAKVLSKRNSRAWTHKSLKKITMQNRTSHYCPSQQVIGLQGSIASISTLVRHPQGPLWAGRGIWILEYSPILQIRTPTTAARCRCRPSCGAPCCRSTLAFCRPIRTRISEWIFLHRTIIG